jgi:hypothetical protein
MFGSKTTIVFRSGNLGRPVTVRVIRGRLPWMKVEPDWSQRWETSADYSERQLNIRPEKYRGGVINDIIWVFDVLLCNRVCSNDSGNAHGAYTGLLAFIIALRLMVNLRCA